MSHSTNILIKLGLDAFDLYCGSRQPAEAFGGGCRAVENTPR